MICYKDRTFCLLWPECKHGENCPAKFDKAEQEKAFAWWGGKDAPVSFYSDKPECFEDKKG